MGMGIAIQEWKVIELKNPFLQTLAAVPAILDFKIGGFNQRTVFGTCKKPMEQLEQNPTIHGWKSLRDK